MAKLRLTPSLFVEADALAEHFVRSSGPGGQNVNKVASAVELRFDLSKAGLPDPVRMRAARLAGHKLASGSVIVIHAHEHRAQLKNRQAARERLADLLNLASKAPRPRRATRPTVAAREQRLKAKHRRTAVKRRRAIRAEED